MQMVSDMKIATKLMILVFVGLFVVSSALTGISAYRMYQLTRHNLASYQVSLLDSYDQMIKGQVQTVCSSLNTLDKRVRNGELLRDEALRLGADLIRVMRYGSEGYFWVDTVAGVNVVHPNRSIEGKNRINDRDAKGKLLIQEIISKGRQPDGGFTEFWYTREGGVVPLPKRGYSLEFKPFGWVVGTGNYIGDIQKILDDQRQLDSRELDLSLRYLLLSSAVTIAFFMGLVWLLASRLILPLRNCVALANRIAAGDLDTKIVVSGKDEVGQLSEAMNSMMASLRTIVDLKTLAQTDTLTYANNRGYFLELLDKELQAVGSSGSPLTLILFDVDHFKRINDTYGHAAGDEALRVVSRVVRSFGLRHTDFWGRLGGEEFAIALPNTSLQYGGSVAERLRKTLAGTEIEYKTDHIQVTVSLGVAEYLPGEDSTALLNRVDEAMYRAKALGRNRICFSTANGIIDQPLKWPPSSNES